ncbi:CP family cyanate transporter-like MFS transporter [Haloactinopolyspora alba]|uniref:CP family cyanate transporter-like MFS transporter n=1 Tax=Haloactinopolyspora alba TaxID=648780 RepID=A0A2P8D2L1_9ACTN|nr:MFS transporter [Haloactinopolyspora alba]PSK91416.1 CP family cyanate transporter-like MFS transporter [Haloactinopolyspora alba]
MIGAVRVRPGALLAVSAIALISLNLRPAANGMGTVIPEVRADLGLSATVAGLLNALPGLCFVVFGLTAPAISARFGPQRTVAAGLVAMIAGQLFRVTVPGVAAVFAGSVLALAGMAMGNVLLPRLVRTLFPGRVPAVTAIYTTCMLAGATAASGLTVPIGRGLDGGWRAGLGSWSILACLALVPWVALLIRERAGDGPESQHDDGRIRLRSLVRNRVAWSMALFFGMQSMHAYVLTGWLSQILVDAGVDLPVAGSAVALFVGTGLPMAAVVPALARRQARLPALIVALGACYVVGYTGLIVRPADGLWVWAVVLGAGSGAFPLTLMMVTLRARTLSGLTALSAFGQSAGYVLATLGPFVFGLLHDLTGGWAVSSGMMIAVALAMVVFGLLAARPRYVEDHLLP